MLSPFISGKTSRELLQGPEKGGGLGFPQPKGLPLCLGVGASDEGLRGWMRYAGRLDLPELIEDQCSGAGDPHRRPFPLLPHQFLPCPASHLPFLSLIAALPMRPSQGLTPLEEEPRPSGQASVCPHSAAGAQFLTHDSLTKAPSPSQNLASHFKASEDFA